MGAGGLRVAQFVLIGRLPSHCPFMLLMAVSASWTKNNTRKSVNNIDLLQNIFLRRFFAVSIYKWIKLGSFLLNDL